MEVPVLGGILGRGLVYCSEDLLEANGVTRSCQLGPLGRTCPSPTRCGRWRCCWCVSSIGLEFGVSDLKGESIAKLVINEEVEIECEWETYNISVPGAGSE
jgi:hypothetical protein